MKKNCLPSERFFRLLIKRLENHGGLSKNGVPWCVPKWVVSPFMAIIGWVVPPWTNPWIADTPKDQPEAQGVGPIPVHRPWLLSQCEGKWPRSLVGSTAGVLRHAQPPSLQRGNLKKCVLLQVHVAVEILYLGQELYVRNGRENGSVKVWPKPSWVPRHSRQSHHLGGSNFGPYRNVQLQLFQLLPEHRKVIMK